MFGLCLQIPQSDALKRDVEEMIDFVKLQGNVEIRDDPYWNSKYEWFENMPIALKNDLSKSDLVIVKGDANYRKLVGERKYEIDQQFSELVDYFPSKSLVAMRGLKCELCVGLSRSIEEQQQKQNPKWKVDGTKGVIQFHLKK